MENENTMEMLQALQAKFAEFEEKISANEELLTATRELQNKVDSLAKSMQEKMTNLTNEVTECKNEIATVKNDAETRIEDLEAENKSLTSEVGKLNDALEEQGEQITKLTDEVKGLGEKLVKNADNIRAIAKIQASTTSKDDFDKNIPAIENVLQDYANAKTVKIFLYDIDEDALYHADENGNRTYIPKDTVFAQTFENGLTTKLNTEEMMNEKFAGFADTRFSDNCALMPVKDKNGKMIGVVYAENINEKDIFKLDLITTENAAIREFGIRAGEINTERELGTDRLTRLYNGLTAPAVQKFVENDIRNLLKAEEEASVIYIDVDNFKGINDTYGHENGDKALHQVGQTIKSITGDKGCAIRLHGDELAIIVKGSLDVAEALANRISEKIAESPLKNGNEDINITISAGAAKLLDTNVKAYLAEADKELYRAKSFGKNVVAVQGKNPEIKDAYVSKFVMNTEHPINEPYSFNKDEEVIAMQIKDKDGYVADVSVRCEQDAPFIQFNGEVFTNPDEYPQALIEALRNNEPLDWDNRNCNELVLHTTVTDASGHSADCLPIAINIDSFTQTADEIKALIKKEALQNLAYGKDILNEKAAAMENNEINHSDPKKEAQQKPHRNGQDREDH